MLAGGTFVGILMNQGLLEPGTLLSLGRVGGLDRIEVVDGELRLGAMATHRAVERSDAVREGWPVLARAFSLVASPRVRNQATVGGVLADADYASDPPAVLTALGARALLRSARGERLVGMDELIRGHYETCIADDELLVEVRVPPCPERAVYRKFRSRSSEDRPCVAVAAVRGAAGPARGGGRRGGAPAGAARGLRERRCARRAGEPLRRGDRADERLARQRRLPAPGDRGRGAARAGGARVRLVEYAQDAAAEGMWHAAFVRSPHPHARVVSVDASELPAGCVALLPEDTAGLGRYGCQLKDQDVLANPARFVGDIVAAVAAPSAAEARAAAAALSVTYEELPAVFDPLAAVAVGAPLLHPSMGSSAGDAVSIGVRPLEGTNVCHRFRLLHGDAERGLAASGRGRGGDLPHGGRPARAHGAARHAGPLDRGRPSRADDRHPDAVQPA